MRIILQKGVDKLGSPGDVVEVADGYARNYLVPRGLAMPASKGAVRHAERLRRTYEERTQREVAEAQELAARLSSTSVRISAKAGEEGRLFGSITVGDIAAELDRAGVGVDRRRIHLPAPIRSIGAHEVSVHLHAQVDATLTVEIVPD